MSPTLDQDLLSPALRSADSCILVIGTSHTFREVEKLEEDGIFMDAITTSEDDGWVWLPLRRCRAVKRKLE
jgi:hypothetical protein